MEGFDVAMSSEEAEIMMAQLLGTCSFPSEQDLDPGFLGFQPVFWTDHVADSCHYGSQDFDSSSYYWPDQENVNVDDISTSSWSFAPHCDYQTPYYMSESNVVPSINESPEEMVFGDQACVNKETTGSDELGDSEPILLPKRKFCADEFDSKLENNATESPKKKGRVSLQNTQKGAKNSKSKKTQKASIGSGGEEESNNAALNGQNSCCCSSEDDSNASQELNEGSSSKGPAALNLNGKTRATRGSATDPQSLYARKRRERINERLRILQTLVPNGTKVDISTMLEEAVQYVKFLQLQIKLLSSDDLWMYAPLAYNGMDIGLDLKISPPKP